jgi:orotidine-5'-phosphate decarboxylase
VKVGSVLFTAAGPEVVGELRAAGRQVFLDLKWHDIPNTVAGAVRAARQLGAAMVTVHALGGGDMLRAAKEAAGPRMAVVAVTVLTSHDPATLAALLGRERVDPMAEVERLADLARSAGLDGVVCSPLEAAALRARMGPGALLVTPGIRGAGATRGDQARVAAAAEAVRAGATHLVVGRPVLEAADPVAAWQALAREVAA